MIDLSDTIIPKSDQLNADDLVADDRTITIREVKKTGGPKDEQPVLIYFEGDGGKPWKPCKGMRRLLVMIWGKDGSQYVGRQLTLTRDPTVTWAGAAVGGIRVTHASHINGKQVVAIAISKQVRRPVEVLPLATKRAANAPPPEPEKPAIEPVPLQADTVGTADFEAAIRNAPDQDRLVVVWNAHRADRVYLNSNDPDRLAELTKLRDERIAELQGDMA